MKIYLLFIYVFLNTYSFAQLPKSGRVFNSKTNSPLPFVNIGIKGTYSGTTTNINGEFSINLPSNPKFRTLVFSCIGYENKEYTAKEGENNLSIKLIPHSYDISEVTIMPDSTLRSFLRKAYDKIPENYPNVPTKYEGFYRASIQNQEGEYLRFMEVLTEAYKSSYKNKEEGTVKVLKSRKYLSPNHMNQFAAHFYGGVHLCHSVDFVKNRTLFLSGSKKYQYTLLGLVNYNNSKLYQIKFKPVKDDGKKSSGYFYIDTKTLAYIKIEINRTKKELEQRSKSLTPLIPNDITSTKKWLKVNYEIGDSYCYLKSIFHSESYKTKDSIYFTSPLEYVVTEVHDSYVEKIPFNKQVPITYLPAIEAQPYFKSNWKSFNTLPSTGMLALDSIQANKILSQRINQSFLEKYIEFYKKMDFSFGVGIWSNKLNPRSYQLSFQNLNFRKEKNSINYFKSYYFDFGYKLNNKNIVLYQWHQQLQKDNFIKIHNFGYKRLIPLKTLGRQIIANINAGWEWEKIGFSLGTAKSEQDFSFGGRKFKNEKVQAYAGYKSNGLSLGSGIDIQLSNVFHLSLSGSYFMPSKTEDIVILQERSGFFLGRKKAHEKISHPNVQYSIDGQPSLKSGLKNNNWSFSVGLKMKM
ncbi:carboxypeptidase-like regulatory domain-containing protein [Saccharicrinis fermentans]|uniref:TonB-linked outer membrane protein, SusC/RagA family n=1 Tax=Saccharicrinis fermentans DSM 9555 = JCM 21142 TaxID=869213 RepID=W7YLW9_9BACT|nr:carboxypeptidase-like regulatory domain-containing protein [Saccharicrinis fermentans]GAF03394.1 TonB-linked outer membrane protein, SusC/RagA family [Saccharicrinis fermentans DSM 9555 = JCM 21142]